MILQEELQELQDGLTVGWADDIKRQIDYLTWLAIQKARINSLKVEAESNYIAKLTEFINLPKVIKEMKFQYDDRKNVYCKDEILFKMTIDRLSSTIELQTRVLITFISYAKSEMAMINN